MTTPTFEGMPDAIQNNTKQLDRIEKLLNRILSSNKPEQTQYFDVDSLIEYLPGHPAKQTIYGKIYRREIPFGKQHGRLYFVKEDIDRWLNEGRKKTKFEIYNEAGTSFGKK